MKLLICCGKLFLNLAMHFIPLLGLALAVGATTESGPTYIDNLVAVVQVSIKNIYKICFRKTC